jgi:hypothetical protein
VREGIGVDRSTPSGSEREREERVWAGVDRQGPPASERGHTRGWGVSWASLGLKAGGKGSSGCFFFFFYFLNF